MVLLPCWPFVYVGDVNVVFHFAQRGMASRVYEHVTFSFFFFLSFFLFSPFFLFFLSFYTALPPREDHVQVDCVLLPKCKGYGKRKEQMKMLKDHDQK